MQLAEVVLVQEELRQHRLRNEGADVLQLHLTFWFVWLSLSARLRRLPSLSSGAIPSFVHVLSPDMAFFPENRSAEAIDTEVNMLVPSDLLPSSALTFVHEMASPKHTSRNGPPLSNMPSLPIADSGPQVPSLETGPDNDAGHRRKRRKESRNKKQYRATYIDPTPCRDGDGRNYRCPAISPPSDGFETAGQRMQCASWHTRDGLLDHLYVSIFRPYLFYAKY